MINLETLMVWYKKNKYLTINQILEYSELREENFKHFCRILTTVFNEDYTSGILYEKTQLVFKQCKEEHWAERDFSETLANFVSYQKFLNWTPANFFEFYKPVKLYDRIWAECRLKENPTLSIEHFVIPVDGNPRNFYCLADERNRILGQYKSSTGVPPIIPREEALRREAKEEESWKSTEGEKLKRYKENNAEYKNMKKLFEDEETDKTHSERVVNS